MSTARIAVASVAFWLLLCATWPLPMWRYLVVIACAIALVCAVVES